LLQLYVGLVLFGVSIALMVQAGLGLDPWDVFHQGLAERSGLRFGWVVIGVSALVLILWFPLRQHPGIGTVSNVVVVGLAVDASLAALPEPREIPLRIAFLVTGILANGVATGLYIGAGLGPGPRDGLMTGLAARGHSIRLARTAIELSVLAAGWLLGGTVGAGTVLYAVSIGPLAHYFIPRFTPKPTDGLTDREYLPTMPRLHVIITSTRPGRVGPRVAEWFAERAENHGGFAVEVVDLADVNLPFLDEPHHPSERRYVHQHTRDWSATVDAADAFVFVMPEYNQGFNAPLKNALDYLYHEWQYKPVGFVSYGMTSAGLRAVQMIKPVMTTLKMMPVTEAVSVPLRQRLDSDGRLRPDRVMEASATVLLDELQQLTPVLATLRKTTGAPAR